MLKEDIIRKSGSIFNCRQFTKKYFEMPWHHHPEYELVYISSGKGRKFIGEAIVPFSEGDISLIGPDLPHYFIADDEYFADNGLRCSWKVIQFDEGALPAGYRDYGLFRPIAQLLSNSSFGLNFRTARITDKVPGMIDSVFSGKSFDRLSRLYELLGVLALDRSAQKLNETIIHETSEIEDPVIRSVYNYLVHNFKTRIRLEDIADKVCMQPAALCSYYRKHTLRTIFETLTDIRINYAAGLIINTRLPIYQIAYESGFFNISNFNRHFLSLRKMTPAQYRKMSEEMSL